MLLCGSGTLIKNNKYVIYYNYDPWHSSLYILVKVNIDNNKNKNDSFHSPEKLTVRTQAAQPDGKITFQFGHLQQWKFTPEHHKFCQIMFKIFN